ncbi:hypothetical protein PAMA_007599 [Pampus argenteus]
MANGHERRRGEERRGEERRGEERRGEERRGEERRGEERRGEERRGEERRGEERASDSDTLAPDTVLFPEADCSSAACLNADVTQRSEQAQLSGRLSHFENIPDMIAVSGMV